MVEVKVRHIGLDSITGSPVLMLSETENENHIYPIWIGIPEAEGIILAQSNVETPRPLTYDLVKNIIESLGAYVERVAVVDYKNGAYIAEIVLKRDDGEEIIIDSRPSDAINIALRFNAPIYLDENVVKKVDIREIKEELKKAENKQQEEDENIKTVEDLEKATQPEDEELERFRQMLENIKPEDFAKKPEKNNKEDK